MKKLLLALAMVLFAATYASAQNCVTINGNQRCSGTFALVPQAQPVNSVLEGTYYYDATSHLYKVWNGTSWVAIGAVTSVNLGSTSTDGLVLQNITPSNSGTTAQISPRVKWCGTAWNSTALTNETDCMFIEGLPFTQAGTTTEQLKIGFINTAGTLTYPWLINSGGSSTQLSTSNATSFQTTATGGSFYVTGRSGWLSSANKLFQIEDNAAATGAEVNVGTASLGTCTGGTITSGSHNFGGEVTGNSGTTCVINFGAPTFTNTPFCIANDENAAPAAIGVGTASASSITVTVTANHNFTYICLGRIGT